MPNSWMLVFMLMLQKDIWLFVINGVSVKRWAECAQCRLKSPRKGGAEMHPRITFEDIESYELIM